MNRTHRSGGPSSRLERTSLVSCLVTVCALPWLLGGFIPLAQLVLACGSLLSLLLALAARLWPRGSSREESSGNLPLPALLLLWFALIAFVQMQPVFSDPVSVMKHSEVPEYREEFFKGNPVSIQVDGSTAAGHARTLNASDTRVVLAQWLGLAAIVFCAVDTIRTPARLIACLVAFSINGVILVCYGILRSIDEGGWAFWEQWKLSDHTGFGPFVNPNNAAGWLSIQFAAAVGLMVFVFGRVRMSRYSKRLEKPSFREACGDLWLGFQERLANLSGMQLTVVCSVVLLYAGILWTLSRAGLLAATISLLACLLLPSRPLKAVLVLLPVAIVIGTAALLLAALEMDTLVAGELATLKDPVSAVTVRYLHWTDTIRSVLDFPLIGSGFGSYRYSTLPYQGHFTQHWFMHADNQYLEILVESGTVGLLLFLTCGGLMFYSSLRLRAIARRSGSTAALQYLVCSLVGLMVVVSQSFAATFDYGVAGAATAASIALIAGILTVAVAENGRTWLLPSVSPLVGAVTRIGVLLAIGSCIPDLWASHLVREATVPVERFLTLESYYDVRNEIAPMKAALASALDGREDDYRGRSALAAISEAEFRLGLMEALNPEGAWDQKSFDTAWAALTLPSLSARLAELDRRPPTGDSIAVSRLIRSELEQSDLSSQVADLLALNPINISARSDEFHLNAIRNNFQIADDDWKRLVFAAPADARRLYQSGHVCMISGHLEPGKLLWSRSLEVSEIYRGPVLQFCFDVLESRELVEEFMPTDYVGCVNAAATMVISDSRVISDSSGNSTAVTPLKTRLWKKADELWETLPRPLSISQQIARGEQLWETSRESEAREWMESCVGADPENLELGRSFARRLGRAGLRDDAIREWYRIQYHHPRDREAALEIKRLQQRPLSN